MRSLSQASVATTRKDMSTRRRSVWPSQNNSRLDSVETYEDRANKTNDFYPSVETENFTTNFTFPDVNATAEIDSFYFYEVRNDYFLLDFYTFSNFFSSVPT